MLINYMYDMYISNKKIEYNMIDDDYCITLLILHMMFLTLIFC